MLTVMEAYVMFYSVNCNYLMCSVSDWCNFDMSFNFSQGLRTCRSTYTYTYVRWIELKGESQELIVTISTY